jgi:hypothetical protein
VSCRAFWAGLERITGLGSPSVWRASAASTAGSGGAGPAPAGGAAGAAAPIGPAPSPPRSDRATATGSPLSARR